MTIAYPSREFDDAVAAVCHGTMTEEVAGALNALLRTDAAARDDYLLRLELHARLGSDPELFEAAGDGGAKQDAIDLPRPSSKRRRTRVPALAVMAAAAGLVALAAVWWSAVRNVPAEQVDAARDAGLTSKAVAMLNQAVDATWMPGMEGPAPGAPLEPGLLRLKSGLVQVVFYSGARVTVQGPADFALISHNEASCSEGRLIADVPPQARGFKVATPQAGITDLGTSFGLSVDAQRTEVHVFAGEVELQPSAGGEERLLRAGDGALVEGTRPPQAIAASPTLFASLFYLESECAAAVAERYDRWKEASNTLNLDPSLLVHLDFEGSTEAPWRLRNSGYRIPGVPDASVVGCQWASGRWPEKRSLEFGGLSDRVRLSVPGEFESLTLAAWVRIQGLDRQINALFMSDGFEPGTVHWSIRKDGVLGLTVIGERAGDYQIVASPPVLALDQFGKWIHLAVVLDGEGKRVIHYVDGAPVSDSRLRQAPPFRIGSAELGNWNPSGFPGNDPFLIRNFSGAMDEFVLFARALDGDEIHAHYRAGKPRPETLIQKSNTTNNR